MTSRDDDDVAGDAVADDAAKDYGQRDAMEDKSMLGTLATQIELIWPLEKPLLAKMGFEQASRVADFGCGTGEFSGRLALAMPHLRIDGIDLYRAHLDIARARWTDPSITFVEGDARKTPWDTNTFDIVVVRHLLQALGDADAVVDEAMRVLKPGGVLYVLAEDYAGIIVDTVEVRARRLFHDAEEGVATTGTRLMHGRSAYRELCERGFVDVTVCPFVVDTENSDRATFAEMFRHWRDGYAEFVATHTNESLDAMVAKYDGLIEAVEDKQRYGCWLLFAVWGRKA